MTEPNAVMAPNGHGAAVDLNALKVTREQKDQLASQLLTQLGLLCPCGTRITGCPVID